MLDDLRQRHGEMLDILAELERLTAAEEPDEVALGTARYRLTRASGRRRTLVDSACASLASRVSGADAERLRAFCSGRADQQVASSRHIAAWSMRDLVRDWPGYCAASAGMRATLRAQIDAERRILYPLLERAAVLPRAASG